MPLMSMPEDGAGDALRLVRVAGELHAAGLAAPADEDLGLDDDLAGARGEDPLGGRARLAGGVGDLPGRDRQALGDEQRLGVGFLDLHAMVGSVRADAGSRPAAGGTAGRVMVAERPPARRGNRNEPLWFRHTHRARRRPSFPSRNVKPFLHTGAPYSVSAAT